MCIVVFFLLFKRWPFSTIDLLNFFQNFLIHDLNLDLFLKLYGNKKDSAVILTVLSTFFYSNNKKLLFKFGHNISKKTL